MVLSQFCMQAAGKIYVSHFMLSDSNLTTYLSFGKEKKRSRIACQDSACPNSKAAMAQGLYPKEQQVTICPNVWPPHNNHQICTLKYLTSHCSKTYLLHSVNSIFSLQSLLPGRKVLLRGCIELQLLSISVGAQVPTA